MSESQVRLPIAGGDEESHDHDEEVGDTGNKNGNRNIDSNGESQTAGSSSDDEDLVLTCLLPSDDDDSDDVRDKQRSGDIERGTTDTSLDTMHSTDTGNRKETMDSDMKKPKQTVARNSSSGDIPVNSPRRTSFLARVGGSIRQAWGSLTGSRHRQQGDEVRGDSMTRYLDYHDNSVEDNDDEKKAEKMRQHPTCVPISSMTDHPADFPACHRSRRQSVPGAFHIQPSNSSANTRSEEHETSASQTSSSQMQGSFEISETMLRSMLSRGVSVQGNTYGGLDIVIPQASVVDDVTVSDAHVPQSSSQFLLVADPIADNSERASLPPGPDESVTVSKHTARFLFLSMMILLLGLTTALFFAMRKYPVEVTPFNEDEFVPPVQTTYGDTSSSTVAALESSLAAPAHGYDSSGSSEPSLLLLADEPTSGSSTLEPTMPPTHDPSQTPAYLPLLLQTQSPTFGPTETPTSRPTTRSPSQVPTFRRTPEPSTAVPTPAQTPDPTRWSIPLPTSTPTLFSTSPPTRLPTPAPVSVAFDNTGGPVSVALASVPVTGTNAGGNNGNNYNNNANAGSSGNGNNNGGGTQQQTFSVATTGTTQTQQQTYSVVSTGTGSNQSGGTAQSQQQTFSVLSTGNGGGQSGGTAQSQQQTHQQSTNASNGGNGGQQNTNGGGQGGGSAKPQQQSSGSGQGSGNNNNGSGQGKANNNNGGGDNSGGNTQGQGGRGGNNNGHNNGQGSGGGGSGGGGSGGGGNGGGNGKGN